jgi:hypothetical protein
LAEKPDGKRPLEDIFVDEETIIKWILRNRV